ncbi:penicillin-binding transpeptidase domain-containing protein [Hamadaea sp.]|uniref:penicillin-binding transpeptidase domain-containing protein n=1 Tax=Hamadaea sp. TaxID=2024425 RepID=UPI0025C2EC78|nr:penicillin-binding transpeptidase domain-containing protein [Hamadaea sp.]
MSAPSRRLLAVTLAAVLAATTLAACTKEPEPGSALDAFAAGWPGSWGDKVTFVDPDNKTVSGTDVATQLKAYAGTLTPPTVKSEGKPATTKDSATGKLHLNWTLPDGAHWEYSTEVKLTKGKVNGEDAWNVVWQPQIVHPDLQPGASLATKQIKAQRGGIVDEKGEAMISSRPVVVVGVEPRKITNLPALTALLDAAFKSIKVAVDLGDLAERVKAAKPDSFVELVTLRREAYDQIRNDIRNLDGTVFREETRELAPTRVFGRALLGSVGEVTKEIMDANPGKYQVGDQVGLFGLEKKYDERLRGTDGFQVVITSKTSTGTTREQQVYDTDAVNGQPLKVTLDTKAQNAADAALATKTDRRTAIVAIRISDGHVVAVANGPDGGGDNLAFLAQVPPGSTFKVVTAYGVLDNGSVTSNTVVNCPKTFTVDGRVFKNAHDFELGAVPFHTDIAKSCNTAFASLAPKLGPDGLAAAGTALGLGTKWDMGVDCFTGAVSSGGSAAERAAAAFGQGTTIVSPLAMAGAIAAVARGKWKQPILLLDPAPAAVAEDGPTLKTSTLNQLRPALREVVTSGTGKALADVPGGPVSGKTGTAEFDANPAHTHAWFVGWQGDIAFAVFVENGGDSTASAVPLAEAFLRAFNK